ncbi:MAG TPA: hypothetical protein VFX60_11425 [Micromonospora sp.]|nr:hypothetical protein [Micromonospora sp.]
MIFDPGRMLLWRYWRGGRISVLQITRVIADDECGLRLFLPAAHLVEHERADLDVGRAAVLGLVVLGRPGRRLPGLVRQP